MRDSIFVVNAGSSSIKFQLFSVGDDDRLERRMKGQMDGIGSRPRLVAKGEDGKSLVDRTWQADEVSGVPAALDKVVEFLREASGGRLPSAVGHRVVHGGPDYSSPVAIDADVLRRLEQLTPLAPLHQPNNLAPIRMLLDRQPRLLQVACFDTAFHRGHPEVADRYAIPEDLYREGVRRYGFHGLSYEYVAERLRHVAPDLASKKVIVAHLGSGASMCALDAGRSVESTMGFTALDGLPMGTRPGPARPRRRALPDEREADERRGDLGAALPEVRPQGPLRHQQRRARAAGQLRPAGEAGARLLRLPHRACLPGCWRRPCRGSTVSCSLLGSARTRLPFARPSREGWHGSAWTSIPLPTPRARAASRDLESRIACYVIPTDEELMIARHTLRVLRGRAGLRPKESAA